MSSRSFPLTIQRFVGPRSQIRVFFELADDTRRAIDAYLDAGEVLVARRRDEMVGHVHFHFLRRSVGNQIDRSGTTATASRDRNSAGQISSSTCRIGKLHAGVGGTAAADIGNRRFYQRLGFRMDHIERDAFCPDRGYTSLEVNGIQVRDRVCLSVDVSSG
jgi:hypothetical protein